MENSSFHEDGPELFKNNPRKEETSEIANENDINDIIPQAISMEGETIHPCHYCGFCF